MSWFILSDPDFNPKEAKKMEEQLKKMEKKSEKKTFKGTAKAVGIAAKLSPKSQRKKDLLLNSTAQLKVLILSILPALFTFTKESQDGKNIQSLWVMEKMLAANPTVCESHHW